MFDEACALLERALDGGARREIVEHAMKARKGLTLGDALQRLRHGMRADAWPAGNERVDFAPFVRAFDAATRRDGFHVLHDWDGEADRVNDDTIAIDVLDYVARLRGGEAASTLLVSILLDYYFVNILALLSLRVWDQGDADARLDRVNALLHHLQGPDGSGQRFVDNAETLMLIATSHFEVVEIGYEKLLARVKTLNHAHRRSVALGHAASMGCHLRFGFEATYARDTMVMRGDNLADYPWLCFAIATLIRDYSPADRAKSADDNAALVEALLCGLSADARAFVGEAPASLTQSESDRVEIRDRCRAHRDALIAAFDRFRPTDATYSPLSFFFNFSHNVLKGTIIDAVFRRNVWPTTFNDLLSGLTRDEADDQSRQTLAKTLMGYARANPDRIRGQLMPVIVYDPQAGRRAFNVTMEKLRQP